MVPRASFEAWNHKVVSFLLQLNTIPSSSRLRTQESSWFLLSMASTLGQPHVGWIFLSLSLPSLTFHSSLCGNPACDTQTFVDFCKSCDYFLETNVGKVQPFLGTKRQLLLASTLPSEMIKDKCEAVEALPEGEKGPRKTGHKVPSRGTQRGTIWVRQGQILGIKDCGL